MPPLGRGKGSRKGAARLAIERAPILRRGAGRDNGVGMKNVPEITIVDSPRVSCDGAGQIRGPRDGSAAYAAAALGHPRVYLQIDEKGYVDCGYCDRRFVLSGGPAERDLHEISSGDLPE
jgi:NADH dehydrogenase (ubiquinone) Fe-S protein 6